MVAAYPMATKPMMLLMSQDTFKPIRSFGQSSPYPWEQGWNTIKIDSITPNNQLPFISRLSDGTIELPVKPLFRLGLNYKVAQGSWIRASWGQGFRVPTINEYFIDLTRGLQVLPNPNIVPEDGWTSEIGFKQGFKWTDGKDS